MFDDRPQGQGRDERQSADDDHDRNQQHDEQRRVRRQRAGADGHDLLRRQRTGDRQDGTIIQKRPKSIANAEQRVVKGVLALRPAKALPLLLPADEKAYRTR